MINYHVRKKRRTRYTYRFVGISIAFLCSSQVVLFFMGYGHSHKFATILCFAFALYGLFLFFNSFRAGAYDTDYEFRDEDFVVHTKWGDRHYTYGDVNDKKYVKELIFDLLEREYGVTETNISKSISIGSTDLGKATLTIFELIPVIKSTGLPVIGSIAFHSVQHPL